MFTATIITPIQAKSMIHARKRAIGPASRREKLIPSGVVI
jgi:hypothetical protein